MYTHAAAAVELYRQFDTHSFQCLGNFIKTRKAAEAFIFRATGWWSSSSINAIIFYPNKHLICDGLAPLLRSTSPVRLCSLGHDKRNFFSIIISRWGFNYAMVTDRMTRKSSCCFAFFVPQSRLCQEEIANYNNLSPNKPNLSREKIV